MNIEEYLAMLQKFAKDEESRKISREPPRNREPTETDECFD